MEYPSRSPSRLIWLDVKVFFRTKPNIWEHNPGNFVLGQNGAMAQFELKMVIVAQNGAKL